MTRRLTATVAATLLLGLAACGGSSEGAADAPDVSESSAVTDASIATAADGTPPDAFVAQGFDAIRLRVFDEDGIECSLCSWRADTSDERARGLMEVDDLGGAFAMVFVYDEPTDTAFWMKDTRVPLTIVHYDADGRYLGATDMEPCPDGQECPIYDPPAPFVYAVEVLQGTADDLGLVPGSTVAIGDPCTPDPALVAQMLDGV